MDSRLEKIAKVLQEQAGARVEEYRGEVRFYVGADKIVDTLLYLRDAQEFSLLSVLSAIDYWPQEKPRFHVVYVLNSLTQNLVAQVRVTLDGDSPSIPTATGVFATANWRERELMDMFGILADGHPDPRPLLLPEGMQGHPLRRDYPLGYEEPQFTFNIEDIDLRKLYAKE